jgi:hypothetical protein
VGGGIDVILRSKSKNHIDLEVSETVGVKWRFTGMYGESQSDLKHKMGAHGLAGETGQPTTVVVCR